MSKIEIVKFRSSWADEFDEIASSLRAALDREATRIDHIGSTSVERLAAKDIIDIQITVADLRRTKLQSRLRGLGYRLLENLTHDNLVGLKDDSPELEKLFFTEPESQRKTNVHVREWGRTNQIYALLFRDYLRSDRHVKAAYETVKIELARRFPEDSQSYYAIKDPFMDTIYRGALLWKEKVGWKPDSAFR